VHAIGSSSPETLNQGIPSFVFVGRFLSGCCWLAPLDTRLPERIKGSLCTAEGVKALVTKCANLSPTL
jgi:hypothetical protein